MSTGLPSSTISFAAGIWLSILALRSSGWGVACPSESPSSRSSFSASGAVLPTTLGTVSLPSPVATRIDTSESFSAVSPGGGVCSSTLPAAAFGSTFVLTSAASRSPASVMLCSASNADGLPTTSGTVTFLGRSRNSIAASRRMSGSTIASHHGSQACWRKIACVGSSGPAGAGCAGPRLGILSWSSRRFFDGTRGWRSRGPRTAPSLSLTPPGPSPTLGPRNAGFCTPALPAMSSSRPQPSPSFSALAASAVASSPVLELTCRRRSSERPSQICLGGRTVIRVLAFSPGAISACGGSNVKRHSLSGSVAEKATRAGALALFSTATSKRAFKRPDARSGVTFVAISS